MDRIWNYFLDGDCRSPVTIIGLELKSRLSGGFFRHRAVSVLCQWQNAQTFLCCLYDLISILDGRLSIQYKIMRRCGDTALHPRNRPCSLPRPPIRIRSLLAPQRCWRPARTMKRLSYSARLVPAFLSTPVLQVATRTRCIWPDGSTRQFMRIRSHFGSIQQRHSHGTVSVVYIWRGGNTARLHRR